MNKNSVIEKINELISAPSCCASLKEKAQDYIKAIDKVNEKEAAKNLIAELESDVNTIDDTIGFLNSDKAKHMFSAKKLAEMIESAKSFKAKGEKYCFCPACQAGVAILKAKEVILK